MLCCFDGCLDFPPTWLDRSCEAVPVRVLAALSASLSSLSLDSALVPDVLAASDLFKELLGTGWPATFCLEAFGASLADIPSCLPAFCRAATMLCWHLDVGNWKATKIAFHTFIFICSSYAITLE
jgi:hypothetical protein